MNPNLGHNIFDNVLNTGTNISHTVLNTGTKIGSTVLNTGTKIGSTVLTTGKQVGHTLYDSAFKNFITFIKKKDILQLGIAFIISININNLSTTLIDNFIAPIINRLFGPETGNDKPFKDRKMVILGINFGIGKIVSGLLEFILVLYVVYIIYSVTMQ